MIVRVISSQDFLSGKTFRDLHATGKHGYRATWTAEGIAVVDEQGRPVKVRYGGTEDRRTTYAYVEGVGFIGGWQWLHRTQLFRKLVDSINRGLVYPSIDRLPKRSKP